MVRETTDGSLLVRADASPTIGWGHAIRSLALAQTWIKGGKRATLLSWELPPPLTTAWEGSGACVVPLRSQPGTLADATETGRAARDSGASWVVLDSNIFQANYPRELQSAGLRVLRIDDGRCPAAACCSDIVLNQNVNATAGLYSSVNPHCTLLLGPRYALLRQTFLEPWPARPLAHRVQRVLVTMGGSDPANVTVKALDALRSIANHLMEVVAVVGGSNSHLPQLEHQITSFPCSCRIELSPRDIVHWMARADLAISAAGTTCWELAHLGLPSVLVACAEDQLPIAGYLHEHGYALSLGWHQAVSAEAIARAVTDLSGSPERRAALSAAGKSLVDGKGAERVARTMTACLMLRRATKADVDLLWTWANDPPTRAASFSTDSIPWETHQRWFEEKLRDPNCLLYIGELPDTTVGQVRIDCQGTEGVLSLSVASNQRGNGYGQALLVRACQVAFETRGLNQIHAFIKPENKASVRLFQKAGFEEHGTVTIGDYPALRLTKSGASSR
jgi:UDP-2,4-diacetamido-2,4,6-trideoxy-beta-L-altropyranose hydrolase